MGWGTRERIHPLAHSTRVVRRLPCARRVLTSGLQTREARCFSSGVAGKTDRRTRPAVLRTMAVCVRTCVCALCRFLGCLAVIHPAQCDFSLSDVVQSGFHEEHEAGGREPQEPRRTLCGLRRQREGEADVASPGRYVVSRSGEFRVRSEMTHFSEGPLLRSFYSNRSSIIQRS